MDKKTQLFVITMEECGELIQSCSKILRNTNDKNLKNLQAEAGDVLCMIELLVQAGYLDNKKLTKRIKLKKDKLSRWSDLIEEDKF